VYAKLYDSNLLPGNWLTYRRCPRSLTERIAIKLSDGQIEIEEILAGDTSKLKITLGSALIAAARAVFIMPLCVTTQTFL
jgi:hypothetical protein